VTPYWPDTDTCQVTIRARSECDSQIRSDVALTFIRDSSICGGGITLEAPLDGAYVYDTVLIKAKTTLADHDIRFYIREKYTPSRTSLCLDDTPDGQGYFDCSWNTLAWADNKDYYVIAIPELGGIPDTSADSVLVRVDNTCATVLSTEPVHGTSYTGTIFATFTEDMDPTTLDCSSFRLYDETDSIFIPCELVSYFDRVTTFVPSAPIPEGHRFLATITTDVRDAIGKRLCDNFSWRFYEGSCCIAITGNIDADCEEICDIGDLTALISYLYIPPNPMPDCFEEGNIDGDVDGLVDIGDLTALISYLYIPPNPPPAPCP
jgi:hypothetical protein